MLLQLWKEGLLLKESFPCVISQRALLLLVLAALLLCLLPLLLLGRYDVPAADDFNYGLNAHLAYVHSASLLQALDAALFRVQDTYFSWQGSYSAVLLMCLQPAVFRAEFYCLTPWIMALALLGGTFCLCIALFRRLFGLTGRIGAVTAGILGILNLLLMPVPVESFFWYNGSVYYTFYYGLALAALALAIGCARRGGFGRILLLSLLGLWLGGGNLVTGLSLAIISVSALALLTLLRKKRELVRLLLPTLLFLLGFALNVAAPGNAVRAQDIDHTPDAISAILYSFVDAVHWSLRWFRLPVLGALLFLALLYRQILPRSRFSFPFPVLVSLWSFCLFAAMFCPTRYATGGTGGGRILNIVFYAFLLLLALNLLYWQGWLCRKRMRCGETGPSLRALPLLLALALCLVCVVASALLRGGLAPVAALSSLRSGQAAAYAEEAAARRAILEDPSEPSPAFTPFTDPPYLLYVNDITEDPEDWRNQGMAVFYEKDSVLLLPASDPAYD